MHALRDCFRAKDVWDKLLLERDNEVFYNLSGRGWVLWLLKFGVLGMVREDDGCVLVTMAMEECGGTRGEALVLTAADAASRGVI